MNDSILFNQSFRQPSRTHQMISSRIQSPTSPFKGNFDSHLNMTNGRGFSQIENRKTPPQTQRQNIPRIVIQTQMSKILEKDGTSPNSNYSTRMNQLMPRIAPKKMNEEMSASSPNKNNSRINYSSSKRNNQTQGLDQGMDDSLITTQIHNTKQINTTNTLNNQAATTFYKPKQQMQLDNFMRDIQEQSLGIRKVDLFSENNSKMRVNLNPRTPSTSQYNSKEGGGGRCFKSVTPNTLDCNNTQKFRINQINKQGLRDLVRPYARQPNVIYDDKEYFSLSRNGSPESTNQKKHTFSNVNNIPNNITTYQTDGQNITSSNNQVSQNNSVVVQINNQETHTSNFLNNETNEKVITANFNSMHDNRHIFSEKSFNLQIRESKIPLLKSLLNEDNEKAHHNQSSTYRHTQNYNALYHEKKMEQNLKQNVIIPEDLKNGLQITNVWQQKQKSQFIKSQKENRLNYGILEINSLSSNFDVALQCVKMESLFMIEEYTYDALKFVKENFKVRKICKLYLKHTNDENYKIIEGIFKDKRILVNFKKLVVLERIVILTLMLFSYIPQQPMPLDIQVCLKNLCYYLHNNSTLLIELLLDIFTQTKKLHPNWEKLREIFHLRLKKPNSADKNELVDLILQNNNQIETLFDQLHQKYNYDFMRHLNKFKEEALKKECIADSLIILASSSQDILNSVNETKKTQLKSEYKQQLEEDEQHYFNNVEDYIQYEKKNKVIVANDFQIDDDEDEDNEDDSVYDNSQYLNNSNSNQLSEEISMDDSNSNKAKNKTRKKQLITKKQVNKNTSVKEPFLRQIDSKYKYTLVLDLDETLVHYHEMEDQCGGEFLIRPYAEQFLKDMSKYYEIVIFTAAVQEYADWILNIIDQDLNISFKLYRHHTIFDGQNNIKDLSKLGRNISKTIIIDNLPENFSRQPENGIFIQSWFGEQDDKALFDLAPLLKQIVEKDYPDVRIALRKFSDQIEDNVKNGLQYPHLNLVL